jgi:hypothetical protein
LLHQEKLHSAEFAALIKGLLSPISSMEGLNINIVNAELVARERGIFVNCRQKPGLGTKPEKVDVRQE